MVNAGEKLMLNGEVWFIVTCLFSDDAVFLSESEGNLQRVVNKFCTVISHLTIVLVLYQVKMYCYVNYRTSAISLPCK